VLREGSHVLRPAVKGMTYPVSELDPISAAIGKVVRAHVSCSLPEIIIRRDSGEKIVVHPSFQGHVVASPRE
jgi:hypothetical protein